MADKNDLSVSVTVKRGLSPRVSLDRIALIDAVDELGSIAAAAKRLDLSYKGAWDIVQALNNLFDTPLIEAEPGGKSGGTARTTRRGHEVVRAFRLVQAEVDRVMTNLGTELAGGSARDLFWSLGMRTSARNALKGEISHITPGAVDSEVSLRVANGVEIVAILTCRSVQDLGLKVGMPAIALIKSSFVILAQGEDLKTSARNQIRGVVARREDGAVNSEVTVDIGGGKSLVSIITIESAKALGIAPGEPITALIKAPHVILMVN
jgi:molybdate transport system regulatory protein